MWNKIKLIYVLLLLLFSCTAKNNFQNNPKVSIVTFELNQLSFEDAQMNLELFVKIPMNVLVFNKQIDSFNSSLTVDFSIINDNLSRLDWLKFYSSSFLCLNILYSTLTIRDRGLDKFSMALFRTGLAFGYGLGFLCLTSPAGGLYYF